MTRLVLELLRPYHGWLLIVFVAMLVEIAMSLAAPWPLKIVLDNVVGQAQAAGVARVGCTIYRSAEHTLGLALLAGDRRRCVIAVLGAVASYIDNYYTESVGQWVANDLRMRIYDHLQRLSLGYYDTHQTGNMLSARSPTTSRRSRTSPRRRRSASSSTC